VWNLCLGARLREAECVALAAMALFFGGVYYQAVFPISLAACLVLVYVLALDRDRVGAAVVAGLAAGFTYTTGAVLTGLGLYRVARLAASGERRALPGAALAAAAPMAGFGAVLILQRWDTGRWDAFFRVMDHYGLGIEHAFQVLVHGESTGRAVLRAQTLAATALVLVACIPPLVRALRGLRVRPRLEELLAASALGFWLFPHLIGGPYLSYHRAEALLFPAAVLSTGLPRPVRWALVAACAVLTYRLGALYFEGRLI
jgi:hypothetical protein